MHARGVISGFHLPFLCASLFSARFKVPSFPTHTLQTPFHAVHLLPSPKRKKHASHFTLLRPHPFWGRVGRTAEKASFEAGTAGFDGVLSPHISIINTFVLSPSEVCRRKYKLLRVSSFHVPRRCAR